MITAAASTPVETTKELTDQVERYLIGSCILDPRAIPPASTIVSGSDFFHRDSLGAVWDVLVDISNSGDPVTDARIHRDIVSRRLMSAAELATLAAELPNGAMGIHYASEVRRFADLRRLATGGDHVYRESKRPDADPADIVDRFKAYTDGVGTNRDAGFVHLADAIQSVADRAESPESWTAWDTPFRELNRRIGGGLQPRQVWLLGARTGRGKTAIALNLAGHFAASNLAVWYASLEMSRDELAERYASMSQRIQMRKWRPINGVSQLSKSEIASIKGEVDQARRLRLWITDHPVETVSTLQAKASLRRSLDGLDVLMVDNLNIVTPSNSKVSRYEQLKEMTVAFKRIAKQLNIGIVILAQLAVEAEPNAKQKDNTPGNHWWADSKRIVDDMDVAAILHQPDPNNHHDYELHITKARAGERGVIPLKWEGDYQTFSEASNLDFANDFNGRS